MGLNYVIVCLRINKTLKVRLTYVIGYFITTKAVIVVEMYTAVNFCNNLNLGSA